VQKCKGAKGAKGAKVQKCTSPRAASDQKEAQPNPTRESDKRTNAKTQSAQVQSARTHAHARRVQAFKEGRQKLDLHTKRQVRQYRKNWGRRTYNDLPASEWEIAATQNDKPDDRIWVTAQWKEYQALALVDGGAQMDLISPTFVNQLRIPWRIKKESCIVKGPFETQWVRRETEPLDIKVEGKTTQVVFDIIDIGPKKDMILGRP